MNWDSCLENGVATIRCLPIIFQNLINAALIFSGATALAFIIVAGFKLMNSGGDAQKVDASRKTLVYAILGLVLILLSFFIVNFIANFTGVHCITVIGFSNCD